MQKRTINYFLNFLSLIIFLIVFITGILKLPISRIIIPDYFNLPWQELNFLHDYGGVLLGVLIIIHVLLHLDWIIVTTKNLFKGEKK